MKKITSISIVLGILIFVVAISGCTSDTETSYSSFKTYDNSLMSFDYPDNWVIDYESTDSNGVYFNSSNGEIRVQIYDIVSEDVHTGEKVYIGRIFDSANYESKTIGNKTYRFVSEDDWFAYAIDLPDNKELYVRGNSKDDEGLQKILETFQSK
ncbi:MAG: hypothetical protein GX432_10525 [Candidatus Atribacteria bacterium]|nr:hypothetical protein [Candidatus Atribacteria bacterium]